MSRQRDDAEAYDESLRNTARRQEPLDRRGPLPLPPPIGAVPAQATVTTANAPLPPLASIAGHPSQSGESTARFARGTGIQTPPDMRRFPQLATERAGPPLFSQMLNPMSRAPFGPEISSRSLPPSPINFQSTPSRSHLAQTALTPRSLHTSTRPRVFTGDVRPPGAFGEARPINRLDQPSPMTPLGGNVSGAHVMTLETPQGPLVFPIDAQGASRMADEKRRRNAGASARFRARRKEKEQMS
ncbi:MAG: hypothetical protein M1828_000227 [Chrysothrix sp. TS-e1954]|nr:MAG: hypothetical protein M1828_000227 [Chrysothrix sp. TS-e1954]